LKNVFNILIVYILFQFIFAVIGVQLFNGKFFYCTDASKHDAEECQGMYFEYVNADLPPVAHERKWARKDFHYDNCFVAMLTLFAVQTSEGWVAILQDSMSSTYEDQGPIPWYRTEQCIFYIVFFVVFPFFFVNIFVALIIVTFNELGEAELEDDMDKNQKSCIDFAIQAKPLELYVPAETTGIRYQIWRLVTSSPFENFILFLIILNTLLLMLKFQGAPLFFVDILSHFNLLFTLLFTIECVLKLSSFGPKNYFKDSWNTFDFITVVGSIIDATKVVQIGFLKLFRAARLIKLLRRSVSVRILLYTFVQSFKALPYVCMLMGILFFIYAIIGMQLFGSLVMDPSTAIERHNNFRHIFQSLLLLFRCATGEAWPEIMLAGLSGRPCDERAYERNETTGHLLDPDQTCGSEVSYIYFVSFIFLCSFIMLNLFVAVIMDNFDYLTRDSSILGSHHLGEFITAWADFDPSGTSTIHYTEAMELLKNIDPPLGFGKKCPDKMAYKRLIRMNMPIDKEGRVTFTTTLFALIRDNLKINVRESAEMDQADLELRATIMKVWPVTRAGKIDMLVPTEEFTGPGKLTVGKLYGGILIYEIWKTTRFSNLEILAKMEQEMASKLEKDVISGVIVQENGKTDVNKNETLSLTSKVTGVESEEHCEEYDQYNDDPNFNNRQREYYNQRLGGLRSRRGLEPISRSLEDPYYHDENSFRDNSSVERKSVDRTDWDRRWAGYEPSVATDPTRETESEWSRDHHSHNHHRRLPQTPRLPSALANQLKIDVNQVGQKSPGQQNLLPAGTPLSFGVNSNITVNSDRNERDHFTRSGLNPNYAGYNGYAEQNGTYSSHPNLQTKRPNQHNQHRQLPALPKQPSALKLNMWRQSSLPEEHNPPGTARDVQPLQPSERHRRLKPLTPTKPSTLSFRQSSTLNGSPSYTLFGTQPFQMPKVNSSPTCAMNGVGRTDTMVHFNGMAGNHHRTLPPVVDRRTLSLGRSLPQAPPPPAPVNHVPQKQNGGFGGLSGMFNRGNQEVDWI